jgi:hypothetical protein
MAAGGDFVLRQAKSDPVILGRFRRWLITDTGWASG